MYALSSSSRWSCVYGVSCNAEQGQIEEVGQADKGSIPILHCHLHGKPETHFSIMRTSVNFLPRLRALLQMRS